MSLQDSASCVGFLPTPASTMPSIYNTYLCKEPVGDVPLLIRNGPDEYTGLLRTLQRSTEHFSHKDSGRAIERIQLEVARLHMQNQSWDRAMRVLFPLWQTLSWRRCGWWNLLEEVTWALRECAGAVKDLETLIAVEWELLHSSLTQMQESSHNFSTTLARLKPLDFRPRSILRAENVLSCISATFAFGTLEGNVGESVPSQVVLSSFARSKSNSITVSQIKVTFEGGLKNVIIEHHPSEAPETSTTNGSVQLQHLSLQKPGTATESIISSPISPSGSHPLVGLADLTIGPGAKKVWSLSDVPREPGDIEVSSITLCISEEDFDLEILITEDEQLKQDHFWRPSVTGISQMKFSTGRSNTMKILPKPPKMQLRFLQAHHDYYTNEVVTMDIEVTNAEEEEASVVLDARILGPLEEFPKLYWVSGGQLRLPLEETEDSSLQGSDPDRLPTKYLGNIASSERRTLSIQVQPSSEAVECSLEVTANYRLHSDLETPISTSLVVAILFTQPFEANFSFLPMIHPDLWPSYFNFDDNDEDSDIEVKENGKAHGLMQRWALTAGITSLATSTMIIDSVQPHVIEIHEAAICKISPPSRTHPRTSSISPNDLQERHFTLEAQKFDLEDRRSAFLNLSLDIRWRREGSSATPTTTRIPIPQLTIPFGEPRVLASARNGDQPPSVIHLSYTIENPSTYTLSFNLTMETSEEFAFSGPKNISVQLVPLSRHTVRYNLLPLVKGQWVSPQFRVFDTHFRNNLKVNAAEGMRGDRKGVAVWVDADG